MFPIFKFLSTIDYLHVIFELSSSWSGFRFHSVINNKNSFDVQNLENPDKTCSKTILSIYKIQKFMYVVDKDS